MKKLTLVVSFILLLSINRISYANGNGVNKGLTIYENSKFALINNNACLFRLDKSTNIINDIADIRVSEFITDKNLIYLNANPQGGDAASQISLLYVLSSKDGSIISKSYQSNNYKIIEFDKASNLIIRDGYVHDAYYSVGTDGKVINKLSEKDIKMPSNNQYSILEQYNLPVGDKYNTYEMKEIDIEKLTKDEAINQLFYKESYIGAAILKVVFENNNVTGQRERIAVIPNKEEGVHLSITGNGMIYTDGSTPPQLFYSIVTKQRIPKIIRVASFKQQHIEIYQDGIYMLGKKLANTFLIANPIIKENVLYYYDFDGYYVYYNKLDLKTLKAVMIKKYQMQ